MKLGKNQFGGCDAIKLAHLQVLISIGWRELNSMFSLMLENIVVTLPDTIKILG